jgi:hypothetical protein
VDSRFVAGSSEAQTSLRHQAPALGNNFINSINTQGKKEHEMFKSLLSFFLGEPPVAFEVN